MFETADADGDGLIEVRPTGDVLGKVVNTFVRMAPEVIDADIEIRTAPGPAPPAGTRPTTPPTLRLVTCKHVQGAETCPMGTCVARACSATGVKAIAPAQKPPVRRREVAALRLDATQLPVRSRTCSNDLDRT